VPPRGCAGFVRVAARFDGHEHESDARDTVGRWGRGAQPCCFLGLEDVQVRSGHAGESPPRGRFSSPHWANLDFNEPSVSRPGAGTSKAAARVLFTGVRCFDRGRSNSQILPLRDSWALPVVSFLLWYALHVGRAIRTSEQIWVIFRSCRTCSEGESCVQVAFVLRCEIERIVYTGSLSLCIVCCTQGLFGLW
jgi:hypothetical protein